MTGVIPIARRHPVVRALLLTRLAEHAERIGLVLSRGDQRLLEVGLLEALERNLLLLQDRSVVAPTEVQDAGVVAQVLADRQSRIAEDRQLLGRELSSPAGLPRIAALEAAVDQDPGAIHLLVEVVGHLLALGADAVEPEVLDLGDLVGGVGRGVAQEQVFGPAAATEHEGHAVDSELARSLRGRGRRADQLGRHLADPERLRLAVGGAAALVERQAQAVERLRSHPRGHHTLGWSIVSRGSSLGANDTVCVWPAATVTRRLTLIACPVGDVTTADRSPVWGVPAWLVTSPFNVSAAVDTSAASS